jgi:hypothetical protein
VCVRCTAPLCAACITKIDGVNHCQVCLAALAADQLSAASHAPGAGSRPLRWLGIALGASLLSTLCWLTLDRLFRGGP